MPLKSFNAPNLGIVPSASEVIAKHLRDRKLQRALMQFFKPENYFVVRRALIEAVREQGKAQNCHRIYWRTNESNSSARALYDTLADVTDWITYEISL